MGGLLAAFLVGGVTGMHGAPTEVPKGSPPSPATLWSFLPLRRVEVPVTQLPGEVRNPIDAFLNASLEAVGVKPLPPASRSVLLRRASLDITGLPPTVDEIRNFESDASPEAWERVVDRLLASPAYGERWARHWLDLARYAESEGFKADETRPNAWRYRDYVVASLNADKPYDRFVQEQIAGDELWPGDPEALVATGFNRHYPDESNARNLMQRRQEILNDITDTVGAVFCGLTLGCARCHDHKYDPISQADYYRFQAFFANAAANDTTVLASEAEEARYNARLTAWESATREIREAMTQLEEPHRQAILQDYIEKYPDNIQVALKKPAESRTPFEHQMVAKARLYLDPASHQFLAPASSCVSRMSAADKSRWQALKKSLDGFAGLHPGTLPRAAAVTDVAATPPPTHVLARGNWNQPQEVVAPGFFRALGVSDPEIVPVMLGKPLRGGPGADGTGSDGLKTSGRRSALAHWLSAPTNPLTARVMVNRLWQYHFGRGLVGTASDFGVKGEAPTHPELLDWLAGEFIRSGWRMKAMHRLILCSAAYQRSAVGDEASLAAGTRLDPEDHLLWRYPRRRLEGEVIRDAALAVSGRLNRDIGGVSVFPELPVGFETRGGWKVSGAAGAVDRRSVYVFVRRNTRYPMFESFDMPDTHESCARRNVTTSPVQALTLLNSRLTQNWAQSFAVRVLETAGGDEERQVEVGWEMAYGRRPSSEEKGMALEFLRRQHQVVTQSNAGSNAGTALVDLCHVLLNSNEFVDCE